VIEEKAYAKVNLMLRITGVSGDYHNLETIMAPIDVYDELRFEKREDDEFYVHGLDNIPDNSLLKAAKLFQEKYQIKGADIYIEKKIPIAAGLGGGSADSSATLRGLNRLYELNKPLKELEELTNQLGSDNTFCLYNKAALCYGRGNVIYFLDFDFELQALLISPPIKISTGEVYDKWRMADMEYNLDDVITSIKKQNYARLDKILFNDLLYPLTLKHPEIGHALNIALTFNVLPHLSGSGSSFFVLSPDTEYLKQVSSMIDERTLSQIIKIKSSC